MTTIKRNIHVLATSENDAMTKVTIADWGDADIVYMQPVGTIFLLNNDQPTQLHEVFVVFIVKEEDED